MRKLIPILMLLLAGPALGQTIQFTADVTQADGAATPTLTWDTTPLAANCAASGDWTGDKGGAGNETLPTITASATYQLSCSWSGTATLSWTPPTENTDGTPYTDPDGYLMNYGLGTPPPDQLTSSVDIANPTLTAFIVENLAAGEWTFVIRARNARGVLSDYSNVASKTVIAGDVSEAVAIAINPVPKPPDLTLQ